MATEYKYPRVTISTKANKRSVRREDREDTTVLFQPIFSNKGPVNKIVKLYDVETLIEIFGDIDYTLQGQCILNTINWLNAGGTVYACRLIGEGAKTAVVKNGTSNVTGVFVKNPGTHYNNLSIKISWQYKNTKRYNFKVNISDSNSVELESFGPYAELFDLIDIVNTESDYIGFDFTYVPYSTSDVAGENTIVLSTADGLDCESGTGIDTMTIMQNFYQVSESDNYYAKYNNNTKHALNAQTLLANRLETPIDIILDAGYPDSLKLEIAEFISSEIGIRPDIHFAFDSYVFTQKTDLLGNKVFSMGTSIIPEDSTATISAGTNVYNYVQYTKISNSMVKGELYATPTYFLAKLIPHNDNLYGVQWPTAGLTRGVLDADCKELSSNPSPSEKNAYFLQRKNYIEKDANGFKFMSQRTYDGSDETEYTALSFINNSRALSKITRELEKLGRDYLFEFNDAATIANMRSALNRYMTEWVSNRTLNYAEVEVNPSQYSDEAVDVNLRIRFTGTIEVISIDIVID